MAAAGGAPRSEDGGPGGTFQEYVKAMTKPGAGFQSPCDKAWRRRCSIVMDIVRRM